MIKGEFIMNYKKRFLYSVQSNGNVIGLFKDMFKAQKLQLQKEYAGEGNGCKIIKIETDLIEGVVEKDED